MNRHTSSPEHGFNPPQNHEQNNPDKPLVRADGQITTDGGQLLIVQYVDIGTPKKTPRPISLVKSIESEYSLAHNDTIRISTPHRFRDLGESMIQDRQEGHAEKREEEVSSNDYAKEREEQEEALNLLGMVEANLSSQTSTRSSHNADTMSYGGGSWIFCTSIQPKSNNEWRELRQSLPCSYNDYTTIHQPSKFAQALGLMFIDQVGPQDNEGTLTHGSKDTNPLITLHDSQLVFHGPVLYTDDVYKFLSASQHMELSYIYPLFVKDREHENQREYRFVMVGNDKVTSQYLDLQVSGMLRDSLAPAKIMSEVRVKPIARSQESNKSPNLEPKYYAKREQKSRRKVESLTRTLTINGQEEAREVQRREVVVSVSSESVVGSESVPNQPISAQPNVANFTEKWDQKHEISGVTVETSKGEVTRVGHINDIEDSGFFTLEDSLEAKQVFEAVNQFDAKLLSSNTELRDSLQQLVKSVLNSDNSKNTEITSAAWHGLWVLMNLCRHYGDIVKKVGVEQERFISISLKPSPKSRADGEVLVGPLGTYAYVLRKEGEDKYNYGGEETKLVLFPDKETIDEFLEFGWEANCVEN